jgi:hypothetical protein
MKMSDNVNYLQKMEPIGFMINKKVRNNNL